MNLFHHADASNKNPAENLVAYGMPDAGPEMAREVLPFTVKIVGTDEELHKAVSIRHAAYARHVPAFAEMLKNPEPYDREDGSVVLLAQSKFDGTALGTMRIQTNRFKPLGLEHSVELPDWLQGRRLAEATRLGIAEGREGRLVKTLLFKAYFQYCLETGIDWMVITARKPLDRQYDALLFRDVFDGGALIPMRHVGNMPHRVMAFEPRAAEALWAKAKHPLFNFIFRTQHPDMDLRVPGISVYRRAAETAGTYVRHRMAVAS